MGVWLRLQGSWLCFAVELYRNWALHPPPHPPLYVSFAFRCTLEVNHNAAFLFAQILPQFSNTQTHTAGARICNKFKFILMLYEIKSSISIWATNGSRSLIHTHIYCMVYVCKFRARTNENRTIFGRKIVQSRINNSPYLVRNPQGLRHGYIDLWLVRVLPER